MHLGPLASEPLLLVRCLDLLNILDRTETDLEDLGFLRVGYDHHIVVIDIKETNQWKDVRHAIDSDPAFNRLPERECQKEIFVRIPAREQRYAAISWIVERPEVIGDLLQRSLER